MYTQFVPSGLMSMKVVEVWENLKKWLAYWERIVLVVVVGDVGFVESHAEKVQMHRRDELFDGIKRKKNWMEIFK